MQEKILRASLHTLSKRSSPPSAEVTSTDAAAPIWANHRPSRAQKPLGRPCPIRRRTAGSTSSSGTDTDTNRFSTAESSLNTLAFAILAVQPPWGW